MGDAIKGRQVTWLEKQQPEDKKMKKKRKLVHGENNIIKNLIIILLYGPIYGINPMHLNL